MFDTSIPDTAPLMQRARGQTAVSVTWDAGRSRLANLRQVGSGKAMLPRVHGPVPEVVLLNTAGGLTGGDRFSHAISVGDGASLVASTQTAERVYRSTGASATVDLTLELGRGASLCWLPQETIFFERGRLSRRIEADLAEDASLVMMESTVLGRAAMGETIDTMFLSDQWRLRRGGKLILAEATRLTDPSRAAGAASLDGARAFSTLVVAAPRAEDRLEDVRARLSGIQGVRIAASARPDLLILRALARDAQPLRAALVEFLTWFRAAPMPRVWQL